MPFPNLPRTATSPSKPHPSTRHKLSPTFPMLLTQLLVGAFFFASFLIRTPHISVALVVLFTWDKPAPSPAFDVVTESLNEIISYQSPPQLYDLIYGPPPPEPTPSCTETRQFSSIPFPVQSSRIPRGPTPTVIQIFSVPSRNTDNSFLYALLILPVIVIAFYCFVVSTCLTTFCHTLTRCRIRT